VRFALLLVRILARLGASATRLAPPTAPPPRTHGGARVSARARALAARRKASKEAARAMRIRGASRASQRAALTLLVAEARRDAAAPGSPVRARCAALPEAAWSAAPAAPRRWMALASAVAAAVASGARAAAAEAAALAATSALALLALACRAVLPASLADARRPRSAPAGGGGGGGGGGGESDDEDDDSDGEDDAGGEGGAAPTVPVLSRIRGAALDALDSLAARAPLVARHWQRCGVLAALDRVTRASVVASCALDVFASEASGAARAAAVQRLRAWLDASGSHFDALVAALRDEERGLSQAGAERAVGASLAAVGAATHLDVTAIRALALACGVKARVFFAAHGARAARLVVLGAGGARVVHVRVSGPRADAHAERVKPAAFRGEERRLALVAPLAGEASARADGGAWRMGGRSGSSTGGAGSKRARAEPEHALPLAAGPPDGGACRTQRATPAVHPRAAEVASGGMSLSQAMILKNAKTPKDKELAAGKLLGPIADALTSAAERATPSAKAPRIAKAPRLAKGTSRPASPPPIERILVLVGMSDSAVNSGSRMDPVLARAASMMVPRTVHVAHGIVRARPLELSAKLRPNLASPGAALDAAGAEAATLGLSPALVEVLKANPDAVVLVVDDISSTGITLIGAMELIEKEFKHVVVVPIALHTTQSLAGIALGTLAPAASREIMGALLRARFPSAAEVFAQKEPDRGGFAVYVRSLECSRLEALSIARTIGADAGATGWERLWAKAVLDMHSGVVGEEKEKEALLILYTGQVHTLGKTCGQRWREEDGGKDGTGLVWPLRRRLAKLRGAPVA
jgi:hypothetical protein